MSTFLPTKHNLREALLFCFNLKKSATDGHRLLCEAYGKHALSIKSCEYWFRRFKSGDFDTGDKERGGRPIKFEDAELEALLDEDSSQTQEELAETLGVTQQAISNRLKVMGNIKRRICTCELLLKRQNRKGFLHRIVTGDEKWIHYDNLKRRKSSVKPGHASTSTAKPNIHGKKLMLCIWWDQLGVIYYELLQPNETITGERYQQQLMRLRRALNIKRPLYTKRHDKALQWDVLPHPLYSPDIAPSDCHMFRSMTHGLAEQHFTSYEEAKNWVNFRSEESGFFNVSMVIISSIVGAKLATRMVRWTGPFARRSSRGIDRGKSADATEILIEERIKSAEAAGVLIEERNKSAEAARVLIEARKKSVEAAGVLIEERKKSAEATGVLVEERIKSAEAAGVLIEERIKSAEAAGVLIEERKKSAEAARVLIEERKKSAEAARVLIEERKKSAEAAGVLIEERKKSAEAARVLIEERKKSAEAAAVLIEERKKSAEATARKDVGRSSKGIDRGEKEVGRSNRDIDRGKKEVGRSSKGIDRGKMSVEAAKVLIEERKKSAEAAKVLIEERKKSAEAARVLIEERKKSAEAAGVLIEERKKSAEAAGVVAEERKKPAEVVLTEERKEVGREGSTRNGGHRKRRQFKQTDAFTRGMVIGLKRAGWSIRQIAADTHLGASTVHRLWRRWLEQGNVAIYRNVGATRVTSARVDRRILRQAVATPQATCTAILQHVQDTLDHSISTRTISRRLVANGLHSCRPLRRLPLTPPNRRQRLEWCRARSTWMTEWHRIVFSDESRLCLSSDSRRVRVWRRRGERSNPAAIVERSTVRQRHYDAPRYVDDVLRPVTLPYLQGIPNALYQQDNARPHTARISQQVLQDVQMPTWPPYSPDLSPIEHVWDIIGRRLHALP
ncbi:SETMAR [Cordylochernes scorpioides]|uniref:SETMAR n=1 Tax=Cordylochernes scorpioides TaxID=51811 RepID=A0ABY6L2X6_9ARAC|nr:SETMAR [Cordylochernes scorpioides]